MSGSKFFVWGGGRWREVSPSGRVAGWGRARFVSAAGGRLTLYRRRAVLRGLRALAAGKPTTVHDGPPLPQIRVQLPEKVAPREKSPHCQRCHGSAPARPLPAPAPAPQPSTEEKLNRPLKPTVTTGTQYAVTVDAGVQVGAPESGAGGAERARPLRPPRTGRSHERTVDKNQNYKKSLHPKRQDRVANGNSSKDVVSMSKKRPDSERSARGDAPEPTQGECKELLIGEDDVAALRRYVELHEGAPFPVDLLRFDEDDDYKRYVFFRLNPIVNVENSRRVCRMLREGRSRTRERSGASLKEFATVLGLQSVEERTSHGGAVRRTRNSTMRKRGRIRDRSRSAGDTDKENAIGNRVRPARARARSRDGGDADVATGAAGGTSRRTPMRREVKTDDRNGRPVSNIDDAPGGGRDGGEKKPRKEVPLATSVDKPGGGREYSALEDAAIVRWVAGLEGAGGGGDGGERARLVNGNRLWRELQPLHHQRTGHFRSWHSLRNRYLRSLLPQLALHVPAKAATRLRIAAATGELKSRKSRRNSIFDDARVRGAWSRRPRSPSRRTPSPPSARASTSSDGSLWNSSDALDTLRRTRGRIRSGGQHSDTEGRRRALRSSDVTSPPRALRSAAAARAGPARTPTYTELTRRYASSPPRPSSSPRPPRSPRPARTSRSKTRRLYNPNFPA